MKVGKNAPVNVKWSVWAGTTPTDLNVRIFVMPNASSVDKSGISVPFLDNGTVYVAPCVNNTSEDEISFSLGLTSP